MTEIELQVLVTGVLLCDRRVAWTEQWTTLDTAPRGPATAATHHLSLASNRLLNLLHPVGSRKPGVNLPPLTGIRRTHSHYPPPI